MKTDRGLIDIKRWTVRGEPALCIYIRQQAQLNQRTIKQQIIFMLKQVLKENNDG